MRNASAAEGRRNPLPNSSLDGPRDSCAPFCFLLGREALLLPACPHNTLVGFPRKESPFENLIRKEEHGTIIPIIWCGEYIVLRLIFLAFLIGIKEATGNQTHHK